MKLTCKNNKFNEFDLYSDRKIELTIGNRYDVISSFLTESGNTFYEVLSDDGIVREFVSERFLSISDKRDEVINKLLNYE
jgi:phosphatidate phosphatase PAH1